MQITSFEFLVFCFTAFFAYYLMPAKRRWYVLLAFSILYYLRCATPYTILYLSATVLTCYLASNYFERVKAGVELSGEMPRKAKVVLAGTIILNMGLLVALKYMNFVIYNINGIASLLDGKTVLTNVDWVASLGISYYTLQMIGYLCDSYWGGVSAEKNILKFFLFGSYFPQMASGPISRYHEISGQLYTGHSLDYQRILFGIQRIVWGFFKKLVVANRLEQFVTVVFDAPRSYGGIHIILAVLMFPLQLYADFSGAMDIIMGVSECFGIHLPENFNSPFFSKDIQELWRRWHITLGTWLKDYIMYPLLKSKFGIALGQTARKLFGKKAGKRVTSYVGLLFVWLAMGIWHGSGWKYIIGEGVWFWLMIVIGRELNPFGNKVIEKIKINTECFSWRLFQSARTFVVFSIGMVFFRAISLSEGFRLFKVSIENFKNISTVIGVGLDERNWHICLLGIFIIFIVDYLHQKRSVRLALSEQNLVFRWFIYLLLIFSVLLWGQYGPGYSASEFIYQGF